MHLLIEKQIKTHASVHKQMINFIICLFTLSSKARGLTDRQPYNQTDIQEPHSKGQIDGQAKTIMHP